MVLDVPSEFRGFAPAEASVEMTRGAVVLDCREYGKFCTSHLPGSVNIQYSSAKFPERVLKLAPQGVPLLLLVNEESEATTIYTALAEAGQTNIAGYLAGGVDAWKAADLPTHNLGQITIHDLRSRLEAQDPSLALLDVRQSFEWKEMGYIQGSILISLSKIASRSKELPNVETLAIICENGLRSTTAASILARSGHVGMVNVAEGISAWRKAGYPTVDLEQEAP